MDSIRGVRSIWMPLTWPVVGRNSEYGNDDPTISRVSASCIMSHDGLVPSSPMLPVQ